MVNASGSRTTSFDFQARFVNLPGSLTWRVPLLTDAVSGLNDVPGLRIASIVTALVDVDIGDDQEL